MLILPLAFFLAILLALGRLYKDNEITALAACGMGVPFGAIVGFGVLFAVCVGILSLFLAPWAEHEGKRLASRASADAEISGLRRGDLRNFWVVRVFFT
jgi:lipopolysaccharide export system permease protein